MPKTKQQKTELVAELTDKFKTAKSVVLVNYRGLNVADSTEVKKECHKLAMDYLALKKTLLKIALKEAKIDLPTEKETVLEGEIAGFFSYADEAEAPKVAAKFAKEKEAVELKGGIVESKLIGLEEVKKLVSIPGREELYAKVAGSIKAPVNNFVGVLKGNLRNLAQVLNAIREQKT